MVTTQISNLYASLYVHLTIYTMTELAVERCVSGQLIFDFATVTTSLVFHLESFIRFVDSVWGFVLPVIVLGIRATMESASVVHSAWKEQRP